MMSGLNLKHLILIGTSSNRNSIRSGAGIVVILLTFFVGLMMAGAILTPIEMGKAVIGNGGAKPSPEEEEKMVNTVVDGVRSLVIWLMGGESPFSDKKSPEPLEKWADYLMKDRPALLSGVLLLLFTVLPTIFAVGSFNQTTGDIATRGLRYLLPRTERVNLYFGRFLGTTVYSLISISILVVIVVFYIGLKLKMYAWGELISWGVWALAAYAIVSLPYIAFYSWMSGMMSSSFAAFITCLLGALYGPTLSLFSRFSGNLEMLQFVGYLKYLSPWGIQAYLFHHDIKMVIMATSLCLFYTGMFLFLGYRRFATRDL